MNFAESIPIAKELAEKQLNKGFDVEAFLILSEISKMDAIPESNIDNHISDIGRIFIDYYYEPTSENLDTLLNRFIQTISEIYQGIANTDDKTLFKAKILTLYDIIS